MKFDPTKNYYGIDISIEENRIIWNFWEFVKNLITLSSPSAKQKEIIGFGAVADEMAIDFDNYYKLNSQEFSNKKLLSIDLINELDKIDQFFEIRSGEKNPEFWNDSILDTSKDWESIRVMARNILKKMEFDNVCFPVFRTIQK